MARVTSALLVLSLVGCASPNVARVNLPLDVSRCRANERCEESLRALRPLLERLGDQVALERRAMRNEFVVYADEERRARKLRTHEALVSLSEAIALVDALSGICHPELSSAMDRFLELALTTQVARDPELTAVRRHRSVCEALPERLTR